jgi:hypothetical protein
MSEPDYMSRTVTDGRNLDFSEESAREAYAAQIAGDKSPKTIYLKGICSYLKKEQYSDLIQRISDSMQEGDRIILSIMTSTVPHPYWLPVDFQR